MRAKKLIFKIFSYLPLSWFGFFINTLMIFKNKLLKTNKIYYDHKSEELYPIDIVYTWVNNNDANWKNKKDQLSGTNQNLPDESDVASRFRENDELRYSLRSVLLNASWVRKIYIVTDNQTPDWFFEFDDRIQFVSHRDIFVNQDDLPCFNSHAIESNLHRIPGLNEHFLYF